MLCLGSWQSVRNWHGLLLVGCLREGGIGSTQAPGSYSWTDIWKGLAEAASKSYACSLCRFSPEDSIWIVPWSCRDAVPVASGDGCAARELPGVLARTDSLTQVSVRTFGNKKLVEQLQDCLATLSMGVSLFDGWPLTFFEGNEAQVRMVLDVVFIRFCRKHTLQILPEEALPESSLLSGKADYVLADKGRPVAVIEAKRNLGSESQNEEARRALFVAAMAQCCALLCGFQSEHQAAPLLGIVTDARGWLLLQLTPQKKPMLQLWPGGQAVLELKSVEDLAHLFDCLEYFLKSRHCKPV